MAKKTPESKEAAAARRQRELALLTSGVAAFSLMGEAPRPEAPAAPLAETPATPVPVAATLTPPASEKEEVPESSLTEPVGKNSEPHLTAAPAQRGGEEAVTTTSPVGASELEEAEDSDEVEPLETVPQLPAATAELDLAQLFVPSAEKKGTTLRITADHQQFFAQIGFILGAGASAPDIIHNILTRFRADYEGQIQKALKKQMRQMMAPKK